MNGNINKYTGSKISKLKNLMMKYHKNNLNDHSNHFNHSSNPQFAIIPAVLAAHLLLCCMDPALKFFLESFWLNLHHLSLHTDRTALS